MPPLDFILLALAALQAPAPVEAGYHMCAFKRDGPFGSISVTQTIPTDGQPSERDTWWTPPNWPRGIFFAAGWKGEGPNERIASGNVRTFFFFFGQRRPMRIVIRRIGFDGASLNVFTGPLSPAGQAPAANMPWPAFRTLARGSAALELVAMREDGKVRWRVPIAVDSIDQVESEIAEAQSGFDALLADRHNRCDFTPYSSVIW
jgi:hypothetical protein